MSARYGTDWVAPGKGATIGQLYDALSSCGKIHGVQQKWKFATIRRLMLLPLEFRTSLACTHVSDRQDYDRIDVISRYKKRNCVAGQEGS